MTDHLENNQPYLPPPPLPPPRLDPEVQLVDVASSVGSTDEVIKATGQCKMKFEYTAKPVLHVLVVLSLFPVDAFVFASSCVIIFSMAWGAVIALLLMLGLIVAEVVASLDLSELVFSRSDSCNGLNSPRVDFWTTVDTYHLEVNISALFFLACWIGLTSVLMWRAYVETGRRQVDHLSRSRDQKEQESSGAGLAKHAEGHSMVAEVFPPGRFLHAAHQDGTKYVHHLFERTMNRFPTHPALVLEDQIEISYAELDELANKIAAVLTEYVPHPGCCAAQGKTIYVMLEPTVIRYATYLACLKVGSVVALLDPTVSKDTALSILEMNEPSAFVSHSAVMLPSLEAYLKEMHVPLMTMQDDEDPLVTSSPVASSSLSSEHQVTYRLLSPAGSAPDVRHVFARATMLPHTFNPHQQPGKVKQWEGATQASSALCSVNFDMTDTSMAVSLHPHAAHVNRSLSMLEEYKLIPGYDAVGVMKDGQSDFQVAAWHAAWTTGCPLVVLPTNTANLAQLLVQSGVTVLVADAAVLNQISKQHLPAPCARIVTVPWDQCVPPAVIKEFTSNGRKLMKTFGSDIALHCSSRVWLTPTLSSNCIGTPMPGSSLVVLDRESGDPVPAGTTGELFAGLAVESAIEPYRYGQKFVYHPLHRTDMADCIVYHPLYGRLHRTGYSGYLREPSKERRHNLEAPDCCFFVSGQIPTRILKEGILAGRSESTTASAESSDNSIETDDLETVPSVADGGPPLPLSLHCSHVQSVAFVHQIFERTAKQHPSRPAIRSGSKEMTYSSLDTLANAIAHSLSVFVTRPGCVVVLMIEKSLNLYASWLAVLKAGAILCVIDISKCPSGTAQYILGDVSPVCVLTSEQVNKSEPWGGVLRCIPQPVLHVAANYTTQVPQTVSWLQEMAATETAMNIVYTSGTTGNPKGVVSAHAPYVNFHLNIANIIGTRPDHVVAQLSSLAFDISQREMFLAWTVGACLVAIPAGGDLTAKLHQQCISILNCVPSLLRMLDSEGLSSHLEIIYTAGEPLTSEVAMKFIPFARVFNGYGCSETPMSATMQMVTQTSFATTSPSGCTCVGNPNPGVVVAVCDLDGQPVPRGSQGEIVIGGLQVALGYHKKPDLSERAFAPCKATGPGRAFRTGDVGLMRPDGSLLYLGRKDDQVQLNGNRLELSGVDALITGHLKKEALVRVQLESSALMVYVVMPEYISESSEDSWAFFPRDKAREMRERLMSILPSYAVPTQYVAIQSMPKTKQSGKASRRALPDVTLGSPTANNEDLYSQQPILLALLNVIQEVCGSAEVQPDQDLYTVLDSVRATRLVTELHKLNKQVVGGLTLKTDGLSVAHLFGQACTPYELAKNIEHASSNGACGGDNPDSEEESNQTAFPNVPRIEETAWSPIWFTFFQSLVLVCTLMILAAVLTAIIVSIPGVPDILHAPSPVFWMLLVSGLFTGCAGVVCCLVSIPVIVGLSCARPTPGVYPLRGITHLKLWSGEAVLGLSWAALQQLQCDSLHSFILRCAGAKVGRNVHWSRHIELHLSTASLIKIGNDVDLHTACSMMSVQYFSDCILLGPVEVGDRACLEIRAYMGPFSKMGADGQLRPIAVLQSQATGDSEAWSGVPAKFEKRRAQVPVSIAARVNSLGGRKWSQFKQDSILGLALFPYLLMNIAVRFTAWILIGAPTFRYVTSDLVEGKNIAEELVVACSICILCTFVGQYIHNTVICLAIRWSPTVTPGVYPAYGPTSALVHFKMNLFDDLHGYCGGSLLYTYWVQLAGVTMEGGAGNNELAHHFGLLPDVTCIAPNSFWGQGAYSSMVTIKGGLMTIEASRYPEMFFPGNKAVIQGGDHPTDCLIGVSTCSPIGTNRGLNARRDRPRILFGDPVFDLPAEPEPEPSSTIGESPFLPSFSQYTRRMLVFEGSRLVTFAILVWAGLASIVLPIIVYSWSQDRHNMTTMRAALITWCAALGALFVIPVLLAIIGVLFKHLIWCAHRTDKGNYDIWSSQALKVVVGWYNIRRYIQPLDVLLSGSTLTNVFLWRPLGANIGSRTLLIDLSLNCQYAIDTCSMNIGSDCMVSIPRFQLHSFEERLLRTGETHIGDRVTLTGTVVMANTVIGDDVVVAPNSVVMKGQELLPNTTYHGIPATRQAHGSLSLSK